MAWILSLPSLFAQAASTPTAAQVTQTAAQAGMGGFMKLGLAVLVIVASFGLGILIAQALKLPEFATKLGFVLFTLIASLAVCYFGWPPKLGIDLSGGVVLVYEVEGGSSQANKLQDLADAVAARLNSGRKEKVTVAVAGENLEVKLPNDADVAAVENQIAAMRGAGINLSGGGQRKQDDAIVLVFQPEKGMQKVDMDKLVAAVTRRINPSGVKEVTVRQYGAEQIEIIVPEVQQSEVKLIKDIISTSGALEFRILANPRKPDHRDIIARAQNSPAVELFDTTPEGRRMVAKWVEVNRDVGVQDAIVRQKANGKGIEALVVIDPFSVTGQYLRRASPDIDQTGRDCITFSFTGDGAQLFGALTGANLPDPATGVEQRLGIVLDNELISAPHLKSQIRDQGQITGAFDKQYVEMVVGVLNAGSLPTALQKQPISQQEISAQLGIDTIRSGSNAMLIATAGVILFMLFYYRFAGMVADIAVVLNMVIAVALMILIHAAFTLPGLAGLVLTVGMAVDANVLIYERMREEQQRGASLRMAIRNGFSRAMSTIIDSNVTTILTGVVLFVIGTDQIKGFAVTLILGLLVSLYTAVFVARLIFDIFEKKRWLTELNMMQWFKKTNFDFVAFCKPALALSLIVIGIGLIGVVARGKDLLDIDFTGGYSVQVQFRKSAPQDISEIRKAVADLPDVAVSSVGTDNLQFKVDTSERDGAKVREKLQSIFGDKLDTYSLDFKDLKPFVPPKEGDNSTEKAAVEKAAPSKPATEPKKPAEKPQPEPSKPAPKTEEPTAEDKPAEPAQNSVEPPTETTQPKEAENKSASTGGPRELALIALALGQNETKPETAGEAAEASTAKPESTETKPEPTKPAEASKTPETPATETPSSGSPTTGTSVELSFPETINYATLYDRISTELKAVGYPGASFSLRNPDYKAGSSLRYKDWTLDILLPQDQTEAMLKSLQAKLASEPVFPSANEIGGKVAGKTQLAALYALIASLVMIVIYVWVRFQNVLFGLAAVLALVHDVLVTLGFIALSYWLAEIPFMDKLLIDQFKISLAVVAALLTIVGYSINDTIVIFDRIREIRGKSPELTGKMINQAVNETLSRTFITSGTVFIATVILFAIGGAGIHPFAYAMLVGVISGTYSTVYIAAPVLLWMKPPTSQVTSTKKTTPEPVKSGK